MRGKRFYSRDTACQLTVLTWWEHLISNQSLEQSHVNMLGVVNRWFRRNRTKITYGVGAVSAIYLAGQYAWGKWLEAQQRIAEERIAREKYGL